MKKLLILAILALSAVDIYAQSAIYACGHIRRTRTTAYNKLRNSGYTTAILFNVNVEDDGTLTTDYDWNNKRPAEAGGIICQDGQYVFDRFQAQYATDVASLKRSPTSISRIEICIGGWGNGSYGHIRDLINKYGIGEESILYRNFKALKEALPCIDAVNNDQEQDYDAQTAAQFHIMMADLGYKTTLAPYTNKSYWTSLVSKIQAQRPDAIDLVYIQCYGGGAWNNPKDWHFGNIPLHAGFDCEASGDLNDMVSKMTSWKNNGGVTGGFLWNYNSEARDVNEWATAINRIFPTMHTENAAATVYSEKNYGGYAIVMPVGKYTQADMALWGIKAKDIASLKVEAGFKITLYLNTACRESGVKHAFSENTADLSTFSFMDNACSLKIEAVADGIEQVSDETATTAVYDIQGRPVDNESQQAKGIYIKGNKKFIKK